MGSDILEKLADSSLFGIYIYQKEGKIVFVNKAFCKLVGYSKSELLGRSFLDFVEKDKLEYVKELIRRRTSNEKFQLEHFNRKYKTKSGILKPVKIFSQTIIYNNSPSGLVFIIDNTEATSFEKLFNSLSKINQTAMHSNSGKSLLKSICNILVEDVGYASACVGKINRKTGLYEPIFISTRVKDMDKTIRGVKISIDKTTPYGSGSVQKAYSTGEISIISDVLKSKDMQFWWKYYKEYNIHSVCSIPIFKGQKLVYVLLVLDDIPKSFTDKHVALLKELKSSISFALSKIEKDRNAILLSKAIKKSHECVVITDENGDIVYANKSVLSISGYNPKELKGKHFTIFKLKRISSGTLKGAPKHKKIHRGRFCGIAKDGRGFYVDSITVPVKTANKKQYFINLSRDITEIIEKERQIAFKSKIYDTLYNLNNLYISSHSKDEFLAKLPEIFTRYMGMNAAFIVNFEQGRVKIGYRSAQNAAYSEFIDGLQGILNEALLTSLSSRLPFYKSLKKGQIYIVNDLSKRSFGLINKFMRKYDVSAGCSIPVSFQGKIESVLVLASNTKNIFNSEVYKLLSIVYKNVSFILEKLEKEKFNKIILTAVNRGFDFALILDKNFNIVWGSDSTETFFRININDIVGESIFSLFEDDVFKKENIKLEDRNQTFSGVIVYKLKNGKSMDIHIIIVPFYSADNAIYYIATGKDITNESKLKEKLDKLLYFDSVTQLHNRQFFTNAISLFLTRTVSRFDVIGCVAIINPIGFFQINRAFGFESGDMVLKEIAKRIKSSLRAYDVVAKLESDRYGVLLKELKNEEDALIIMKKVLDELLKPYNIGSHKINISFDTGLSLIPKDGTNPKLLIDRAQSALADARAKGENTFGFFRKDLEIQAFNKLKLKNGLIDAIKNREFVVYYQPYFDRKGNIVGSEALLRWRKNGKIIPPGDFIPYLEETDMIYSVDSQVLDMVLDNIITLERFNIDVPPVSINIAPQSLVKQGFDRKILSAVSRAGAKNSMINIEIIERAFLNNLDYVSRVIKKLKADGFRLSIDDFGTGYSSLSYLTHLPVDYIKIDISFIRKMLEDKNTLSIVETIIYLAHKLNMKTIAEGVETIKQRSLLDDMGCDYLQGYLFSKPLPKSEFEKLLLRS